MCGAISRELLQAHEKEEERELARFCVAKMFRPDPGDHRNET